MKEWQAIETAPVGEDVLIYCPDAAEWAMVMVCHQFEHRDGWFGQDVDNQPEEIDVEPTHWMPLPLPPTHVGSPVDPPHGET